MMAHTEAYLSGGICGPIWWPTGAMCGRPMRVDLHGKFRRFSEPATFRDVLESILMEHGGDFQSAKFTADTEIVVLRKTKISGSTHQVRVRVRELAKNSEFADLINPDLFTEDFFGEEE